MPADTPPTRDVPLPPQPPRPPEISATQRKAEGLDGSRNPPLAAEPHPDRGDRTDRAEQPDRGTRQPDRAQQPDHPERPAQPRTPAQLKAEALEHADTTTSRIAQPRVGDTAARPGPPPTPSTAERKAERLDQPDQPDRPDPPEAGAPREVPPRPEISEKAWKHILDGELNKAGRPVGFHSAPDGVPPDGRRIDEVQKVHPNDTYEARVSFRGGDGQWQEKEVRRHTMFPNDWPRDQVRAAIQETYTKLYDSKVAPALERGENVAGSRIWFGEHDNINIGYFLDRQGAVKTAFPAP
jgi:hypothetical protein